MTLNHNLSAILRSFLGSSALVAISACGGANPRDQVVCFSLTFPFEDCSPSEQTAPGGEVSHPAPEEDFAVAKPVPIELENIKVAEIGLTDQYAAVIRSYERNSSTPIRDYNLLLATPGQLESSRFVVQTPEEPVYSADNRFEYEPGTSEFVQATLFAHAESMREWFESLGHPTSGDQIRIEVVDDSPWMQNNVIFIPRSAWDASPPSNRFGKADGITLQNLTTDADAVQKQYAISIVYETVRTTVGESLAIIEGLAQSFVNLKNDDPCLGATLCPQGSSLCQIQNQCLRTADHQIRFDQPRSPLENRTVLAGAVWDIRKNSGLNPQQLAQLLLIATYNLPTNAAFADVPAAMILADQYLHQGANEATIIAAFNQRGLEAAIPARNQEIVLWMRVNGERTKATIWLE